MVVWVQSEPAGMLAAQYGRAYTAVAVCTAGIHITCLAHVTSQDRLSRLQLPPQHHWVLVEEEVRQAEDACLRLLQHVVWAMLAQAGVTGTTGMTGPEWAG